MPGLGLSSGAIAWFVDRLLGGEKICVQGVHCSGKTTLLEQVRSEILALPDVAVVLIGPDSNLAEVDARLSTVASSVDNTGHAVVLLDNFDRILHQRDDGLRIEARIHSHCINASYARSVGLLLTTTPRARLAAVGTRGSPLDAALTVTRPVPGFNEYVLPEDREARAAFEKNAFFKASLDAFARQAPREALALLAVRLASDLSEHDCQLLESVRTRLQQGKQYTYTDPLRQLFPVVYEEPGTGLAKIPSLVLASDLVNMGIGSPWPTDINASARRFAARAGGAAEVYWVDKYLGRPPRLLHRFIDAAAPYLALCTKLRLLTSQHAFEGSSSSPLAQEVQGAVPGWNKRELSVQLRVMPPPDEVRLHERQLSFQRRLDGYVLPPFDRVVCKAAVGNASDRYMRGADVAFVLNSWARADVLV